MNKKIIETFISKYHLGGQVNKVRWIAEPTGIRVAFKSEDGKFFGFISSKPNVIDIPDATYGIYETNVLRALLAILEDEIDFTVDSKNDIPVAFIFKDKKTKVKLVLADPSLPPKPPDVKTLPPFNVSFKIDVKFINAFVKAVGIFHDTDDPDSEKMTVISEGAKTKIVLGYSEDLNQTNVVFEVEPVSQGVFGPMHFSAKYFKDALQANKDITDATIGLAKEGIAKMSIESDNLKSDYYFMQITK